jgi:hypothetical protein
MSNDNNAEIDPRFDPAFQRGFDPTIPIEEYVPAPLPRRTVAPPPVAPAVEPKRPAPGPVAVAAPAVVEPLEDADAAESPDVEPVVDADEDSSPSRNPFLLLLVVVAIALIAAGIWLFVRSGDAFNSREVRSQGDYMSLDATIHMAPFIALLGAATAIGVVFVFAVKWRKRR